jgi:hypothetical protein
MIQKLLPSGSGEGTHVGKVKFNIFKAGRLRYFVNEWSKLTSEKIVLDMVQHCHIQFKTEFYEYKQEHCPQYSFNLEESHIILQEIDTLLELGVIKKVNHETGNFYPQYFLGKRKVVTKEWF